jgi:hypothetical protein
MRHRGGGHAEGLVGPTGVVEADPLSDDARGVLLGLEAMTVYAPLLQGADDAIIPFCCGQYGVMNSCRRP